MSISMLTVQHKCTTGLGVNCYYSYQSLYVTAGIGSSFNGVPESRGESWENKENLNLRAAISQMEKKAIK